MKYSEKDLTIGTVIRVHSTNLRITDMDDKLLSFKYGENDIQEAEFSIEYTLERINDRAWHVITTPKIKEYEIF